MLTPSSSRLLIPALLGALLTCGCGNYVSYDPADGSTPNAPEVELMPVVIDDLPELDSFNHYAFAGVIANHTTTNADGNYVLIDYTTLAGDAEALYEIERYAAALASIDPLDLKSSDEQFAFFINAYNVSVIRGVLERFEGDPVSFSVINSEGFFKDRIYTVGGVALSLDQIENLAMRGKFDDENQTFGLEEDTLATLRSWFEAMWPDGKIDARLHAAVNCGALGCPNLLATGAYVFQARDLDAQLDMMTKAWLANPEKGAGPDGISMIFTWFEVDFVEDAGSVEAFITAHREGGMNGVDMNARLEYDWTLNAPENAP